MGKKAKHKSKKHLRQRVAQQAKKESPQNREVNVTGEATPFEKIRVGYISSELYNNPDADFFPAFFAASDKGLFSITGFNLNSPDEVTNIFAQGADSWQNLSGMSTQQAAEVIQQYKLDFLMDISLNSSSQLTDIMNMHPAKHIRKASFWCYTPFDKNKEYYVTAPSLYEGFVTFGVLGSLFSSPEVLAQVMELLLALPQSHLLLATEDACLCQREEIRQELEDLGLSRRIMLSEGKAYPYEKVDIFLGIRGMRAHHLCKAYNRSVPVIVYAGYAEQENFVAEVVKAVGQEALFAKTPDEFKTMALALAEDNERLGNLHRRLYDKIQSSTVMNPDACILKLEKEYLQDYVAEQHWDSQELLRKGVQAKENKDWKLVVNLLARATVNIDELPSEQALSLAWAYFFLKDSIRGLYWAKLAEKSNKPITALYLQEEILVKANRYEEAWQVMDKAFALAEQGEKMLPEIRDAMTIARAVVAYRTGRPEAADLYWQVYKENQNFYDRCMGYSSWLLTHNNMEIDRQELFDRHLGYNALFKDVKQFTHNRARHQHTRLRIGYISPDFRAHVMSHFLWPFLATYNRDEFEVYVYSLGQEDQYAETFKQLVDQWQNLRGVAYEQIAGQIYEDEVDILFDLAGHTNNSGLPVLAYKPAPIQISGLGYMTTTGLSTVDYFLTDGYVDPPGLNDEYFSEQLFRLTTQFCYTGEDNWPVSAGAPCHQRGWVLFGVFNNFGKITEEMLEAWRDILCRVPNAKLLIKGNVLSDRLSVKRIYDEWESKGMPLDRIIFEPASTDYMLRYLDVDIALDTYPYPGGGTTCDALYMGVPVITRYGERHSSRFGYSMLCNIGLSELAAASVEEYVEKAVALAKDEELLDMFHHKLRQFMKKSPLMDVEAYMKEVEGNYQLMWRNWLDKG